MIVCEIIRDQRRSLGIMLARSMMFSQLCLILVSINAQGRSLNDFVVRASQSPMVQAQLLGMSGPGCRAIAL